MEALIISTINPLQRATFLFDSCILARVLVMLSLVIAMFLFDLSILAFENIDFCIRLKDILDAERDLAGGAHRSRDLAGSLTRSSGGR